MTRITLTKTGRNYKVECDGHATGFPDVCAAVSTLVYTLSGWLINYVNEVNIKQNELKDNAHAVIEWRGGLASRAAYEMATIGFLQLQQAYPDVITVTMEGDAA